MTMSGAVSRTSGGAVEPSPARMTEKRRENLGGNVEMADDIYYDPYDFDIDADPYPIWKRLRDEAPLYYNEKYDFFAVSRFDDVERCSVDWRTYRSGRGSVLELIKQDVEIPPGSILFEDPPTHDVHRVAVVARVHAAPHRGARAEGARVLRAEPRSARRCPTGSTSSRDLGAQMPMRTIGMLLGIPEEDQEAIRDQIDAGLRIDEGAPTDEGRGDGRRAATCSPTTSTGASTIRPTTS